MFVSIAYFYCDIYIYCIQLFHFYLATFTALPVYLNAARLDISGQIKHHSVYSILFYLGFEHFQG